MTPERSWISQPHQKKAMRYYRAQNAIWLWLCVATWLSAFAWTVDPRTAAKKSAVGHQLNHHIDWIWIYGMAAAGLLIAIGIWRIRVRAEIIGHMMLAASVSVNFAAVIVEFGVTSTGLIIGSIAGASLWRTWYLWEAVKGRLD